jgi:hypothetical protein
LANSFHGIERLLTTASKRIHSKKGILVKVDRKTIVSRQAGHENFQAEVENVEAEVTWILLARTRHTKGWT